MAKVLSALTLLVLAGCAGVQPVERIASPCDVSEASYDCQVERYSKVND